MGGSSTIEVQRLLWAPLPRAVSRSSLPHGARRDGWGSETAVTVALGQTRSARRAASLTNERTAMTTATRTRTAKISALAGLDEREQAWQAAKAEADRLGRGFGEKSRQAQALADERRRLTHREPGACGPPRPAGRQGQPRREDRRPGCGARGPGDLHATDDARPPARGTREAGRRRLHRGEPGRHPCRVGAAGRRRGGRCRVVHGRPSRSSERISELCSPDRWAERPPTAPATTSGRSRSTRPRTL